MELIDRTILDSCAAILVAVAIAYKQDEMTKEGLLQLCDQKAAEARANLEQAFVQHALAESLQEMFVARLQAIARYRTSA